MSDQSRSNGRAEGTEWTKGRRERRTEWEEDGVERERNDDHKEGMQEGGS